MIDDETIEVPQAPVYTPPDKVIEYWLRYWTKKKLPILDKDRPLLAKQLKIIRRDYGTHEASLYRDELWRLGKYPFIERRVLRKYFM